jgi:hypothetical protein
MRGFNRTSPQNKEESQMVGDNMRDKIMVNVWIHLSLLDDWMKGRCKGYLHPLDTNYKIQLLVPYDELEFDSEMNGTCQRI